MLLPALLGAVGAFFFFVLRVQGVDGSFPKPLSAEKERELLRQMREEGDPRAREALIEHNLRLVAHIVKKYYATNSEQDDLLSIGTIGLIKAVNTFQPDKNIKLATYASKCIQNELLMYFRHKRKSAGELSLSDALETDGDGNTLALLDTISCEDEQLSAVEDQDRYNAMYHALTDVLTPRERQIIHLRYGIGLPDPLPQREIAKRLKISRSYVSHRAYCKRPKVQKNRKYAATIPFCCFKSSIEIPLETRRGDCQEERPDVGVKNANIRLLTCLRETREP